MGAGHRLDLARYSEGALSSLVLNERHLSERLPFPRRKVEFLAMSPYQYRLEPSRDGRATLIDWNWNGILGEENVVADINYDHGTDFASQYDVGRADAAPVLVTHGARQRRSPPPLRAATRGPCTSASGSVRKSTRTVHAGRERSRSSPRASSATRRPHTLEARPGSRTARPIAWSSAGSLRAATIPRSGRRTQSLVGSESRPWRPSTGAWRCFCGGRPTVRSAFG